MSEDALEQAVRALEAHVKAKSRPDRYDLRALLLAWGALPGGHRAPEHRTLWSRTEAAAEALGKSFERAAQDELSLACAEHVHAVDPRYLEHPAYDFDYTLSARERLEQRLLAAGWLGIAPPETLLGAVAAADRRLAPHLARRTPGRGAPE